MKKLFTLLLTLMAFATGAQAVTTIHTIKAKSTDMITFPEIGNPVKTPTFTVTSGSPAFFNTNSGYWEKKVNGVWQSVSNGNFTEGTYRFTIYVHLPLDSGYIFDEETTVWVNDIKWATDDLYAWDHESAVRARSPEITVHLITTIYQVEGTSTDLTNMPVIGESVEEDPQITVTKGAPAYFDTDEYNACWEKLVDGEWKSYHSGNFTEGTWHYVCKVRIDSSVDPDHSYTLQGTDLVVKVNGATWTVRNTYKDYTSSYATVYSPAMTAKAGDPRTKISLVEATSTDLTTIPVIGESVEEDPKITVTKGAPAYFTASGSNGKWQKKVNGEWQYVNSGNFTSGTWRYACQVRIDSSVDPGNSSVLDRNVVVKVNGATWTKGNVSINDTYSFVVVYSPEVTAKAGDSRTKISTVAGTSDDLTSIPVVGESVQTKPTITVTTGSPARFVITSTNGVWLKLVNGEWHSVTTGKFTAGDSVRFTCQVKIDSSTDPNNQYVLDKNVKVKVNGKEWETGSVTVTNTYSYVQVYSPRMLPTYSDIHAVDALTDTPWSNIPWVGVSVTKVPEFEVVIGSPAYFSGTVWEKKVNGQWQAVQSGSFSSGTWRLHTYVKLNSTQGGKLAEDVRVKVDGLEWQRGSYYSSTSVDIYSPEVTCKAEARSGSLGSNGTWQFADGVLTVTYNGQMPQNCTKETTDPEVAYRLKWIDFLGGIEEVVVKGQDVEIQPYFLYYESSETTDGNHPDDHIKKVTLGSGVKSIGKAAFSLYELNRVDCYKNEPPTTASLPVFWNKRLTSNVAWLHLVSDASTSYDNNEPWKNFNPRILRDISYADDPDLRLPVSITLDKTSLEFDELWQTYRLTATVYPSNATNKSVTWTSSNTSVATVSSTGLVLAVGTGKATITAKTINGIRATCEVKASMHRNGMMGDQGSWEFAKGVLTIDYQGAMPDITKDTTDPELAYRLNWESFLDEINEVVIQGNDVEIQPYFLYFEGDGPDGSNPNDHITRVTLSSGVKFIGDRALSLYSLTELLCYGEEPPVLASDNSSSCKCFWKARLEANDAWLYTLPDVFMNYSLKGGEWSYFNIMGDLYPDGDPVGIRRTDSDPNLNGGEKHGWYNLAGQRVTPEREEDGKGLQPGIYIKDGRKVLVK